MDVAQVDDPAAFLDAAGPLLLDDEARHNLMLGIAGTLRDHPALYPDFRLWLVRDETQIVGAALRTPPQNLVLACPSDTAALEALANAVDDELPGVIGALPEVEEFATAWSAKTGSGKRSRMRQGVYALHAVQPVSGVAGAMRDATPADRALLVDWWTAYVVEALDDDQPDAEHAARMIDHRLSAADSGIVLWEDDERVSMASLGGRTPNGIRIGPVYTPPELRGHGYASALVAGLSTRMLDEGRRFCFLHTDLANPTSNKIYERIGYERVCESAEIAFG